MVSLVNFKIVNEELHQHQPVIQQPRQQSIQFTNDVAEDNKRPLKMSNQEADRTSSSPQSESTSVNIAQVKQVNGKQSKKSSSGGANQQLNIADSSNHRNSDAKPAPTQLSGFTIACQQQQPPNYQQKQTSQNIPAPHKPAPIIFSEPPYLPPARDGAVDVGEASNFVVTWRNLRFAIEPKWHQKLSKQFGPVAALTNCLAHPPQQQQQSSQECGGQQASALTPNTKVVLDRLDGSFRSGELTAILGPSGAGKTTLLDCLTGHRKAGLSGSIRISSSSSSTTSHSRINGGINDMGVATYSPYNGHYDDSYSSADSSYVAADVNAKSNCKNFNLVERNPMLSISTNQQIVHMPPTPLPESMLATSCSSTNATIKQNERRNNLKVSIIPQNDHLIGHLTVYETLNYASKMKNCFETQFDHKLNIKRVAQQLGLMSCLGTRINKLSGGQYKRVSIAQELLSSPDILILDEPTSGLDAMTCYQTVQVLRKLTDERQASGLKQIAVILTIHQPNSDVFQQFNHVYVVAQGGKCIYEGPPANIESVINRIGIRLPNSHYNPATMIVEIAAGKFSQDSIQKLNSIQKKQYDFVLSDEQNSTGDSAVDCPSSSSSFTCSDDDRSGKLRKYGLVNRGFELGDDDDTKISKEDGNNNNIEDGNNNLQSRDVIVMANQLALNGTEVADLGGKFKVILNSESNDNEGRRKKRRKMRRRASADLEGEQAAGTGKLKSTKVDPSEKVVANGGAGDEDPKREKRVKLNSLKADQSFPFWRHTYLHFHRSWLSIVRDPMLCSMQLALHIIVPLMVSVVYGTNVGKPNACPRAGPVDIMAYALEPTDYALQLQEDLRTTLENIGYIFFKLYGIIFAAMTVTVLTFPLDMHVLVKEFRNGWYGLSSYFLGRTLADIPFQLTLPLLAMSLSYYATGQPYSYMQWRFFSITAILILSSLIAQSQGLLFGAILMDRMKAAVFVAPAATTPIILFAGFLVRTQSIPHYLRPLSNLSYLRYAIEACLISRYGFNQCECDPAVFNQTVPELPPIARSMLDYWLGSFKPIPNDTSFAGSGDGSLETTTLAAVSGDSTSPDLFTKLIDSLARANSFGRNITSCEQVVPYPMIDYDLKDSQLFNCFGILLFMLIFTRLLTFFIVCFKVKRKV